MGNRLTKIFTKKGDDGTTDLGGNNRVEKFDSQIMGGINPKNNPFEGFDY